jgi:hypothetical protein
MEFVEEFEGGADGVVLATSNTAFASFTGTAATWTFLAAAKAFGSRGSRIVSAASNVYGTVNLGANSPNIYVRMFMKCTIPGAGNTIIGVALSGVTNRAQLTVTNSGKINLRSPAAVVAGPSATVVAGQWVRLEWDIVGATQTLRIYAGADPNSATPTETMSGAVTVATGSDTVRLGTTTSDTWTQDLDGFAVSTTAQPGPHAPDPAGGPTAWVWNGSVLTPATIQVWDGSALVSAGVGSVT